MGFSVIRDTTPPTLTLAAVVQRDVLVTWSATDSGSGVDTSTCLLEVREDEEPWQTFSTECGGEDATYDGQPGHTYTFRLSASDNVSNAASLEVEAVVPYVKKYYYANGQRVATRVDGTLYYVHSDLLGSTVAVSDAAGQAVGRVQYDPYGEVLTSTLPVTLTDRLFTGQRLDSSTGLYYYNARYYDPHLGRFIQPDSLVPDPLNPQTWNRFSYVYNNPTSYVDPGGHVAWVPLLIFGGAFLIGAGAGGYYAYHQGYGFESWQLYAYAGMGGLAGVAGAATGMWIEAALLPVGATVGQAFAAGAAGGFAAGVVEQSILEASGAAILGTEVSGERILLAGGIGGVTGGAAGVVSRCLRLRGAERVDIEGEQVSEYLRHRRQGFNPAQSRYLTESYQGAGHHFPIRQSTGRGLSLPQWLVDSPLNVLRPRGISRGRFYEFHFMVDPTFYGTKFPKPIGGVWRGRAIGLEKLHGFNRIWYAILHRF